MNTDEIVRLIDEITDRLEGPAAQVFEWAVRDAQLNALLWLVICCLVFAATPLVVKIARARVADGTERYEAAYAEYREQRRGVTLLEPHRGEYGMHPDYLGGLFVVLAMFNIMAVVTLVWAIRVLVTPEIEALRSLVPGL